MLVFIDESGHPRPSDNTRRPVLIAVCIKETDIRQITSHVRRLKIEVYGKTDVEFKATDFINRKTIIKNRTRNKSFVDQIVDMISQFDMKIFAVIMERPDFSPYIKAGHLQRQYFYMLKRIELCCQKYKYPMALVVFDEQDREIDKEISIAFNNFLYQSALGKSFEKILEVPLFADSETTVGIQIADILAGIVRHYYENNLNRKKPEDEFEGWLCTLVT